MTPTKMTPQNGQLLFKKIEPAKETHFASSETQEHLFSISILG